MSAHPKSAAALALERHLLKKIQGSPTSPGAHRQDYDETVRRLREAAAAAEAKQPNFIQPRQPEQPPPNNPPGAGNDRLHKKGPMYVTVAPAPDPGDPVPDPAWLTTIQDGIDYAVNTLLPLLTDVADNVTVFVLGGVYTETVTIASDRLIVEGVGQPILYGTVTITNACASVTFSNFDIHSSVPEGSDWKTLINLTIKPGTETGTDISDIRILNCNFYTDGQAIKSSRRTYFENCKVEIAFNANLYNTVPAARLQYDPLSFQTEITRMQSCQIYAPNNSGGAFFDKGWAIDVTVIDDTGFLWSLPLPNSGVELLGCEVVGWTTNYGWTMRHVRYNGTEGHYINDTAGAVHHRQFCNSDANIDAFTFFDGGWVGCEYLAELKDASLVATVGICNAWIRGFVHGGTQDNIGGPVAGTAVHTLLLAGTVPAHANVYKVESATGAIQGFFAPAGIELAIGGGSVFNVAAAAMVNPYTNA